MLYKSLIMQSLQSLLVTILFWLLSSILTAYQIDGQTSEPCPCDCFQKPAFHWQGGRKGTKLEPTLPANKRLAAAQAVLSSLQGAEPLQVTIVSFLKEKKRLRLLALTS